MRRCLTCAAREEKDITASAKSIMKKLFEPAELLNDSDTTLTIRKVLCLRIYAGR